MVAQANGVPGAATDVNWKCSTRHFAVIFPSAALALATVGANSSLAPYWFVASFALDDKRHSSLAAKK